MKYLLIILLFTAAQGAPTATCLSCYKDFTDARQEYASATKAKRENTAYIYSPMETRAIHRAEQKCKSTFKKMQFECGVRTYQELDMAELERLGL